MSETVTPARNGEKHERKPGTGKRDGEPTPGATPDMASDSGTRGDSDMNAVTPSKAVGDTAESLREKATQPRLPSASADPAFSGLHDSAAAPSDSERNAVFSELVTGDQDVVGLVAYSIYKQNKHDFLVAFAQMKGREPTPVEISAYIVGESTPRRLSIYRHLAEATLEGRGPDAPQAGAGGKAAARKKNAAGGLQSILLWAILAGVLIMLVYLFARFGLTAG